MTFALGCALLVLGVVFGVIFWENEAEGTGGSESCGKNSEKLGRARAYGFTLGKLNYR